MYLSLKSDRTLYRRLRFLKRHRLSLEDLQRASNQRDRDEIMRQIVVKGWRRAWFIVITLILEWLVLQKAGFWGGILVIVAACALATIAYAFIDF